MADMTKEEAFFGMTSHPVGGNEPDEPNVDFEEGDEIEIEVVDDRPPEDRKPAVMAAGDEDIEGEDSGDDDLNETELESVSKRVRSRIDKLTFKMHEQRRRAEEADRVANAAAQRLRQVMEQRDQVAMLAQQSQQALVSNEQRRAEMAVKVAQDNLRAAMVDGDPDRVVESQTNLSDAQQALRDAPRVTDPINQKWTRDFRALESRNKQAQAQQNPVPKPSEAMDKWYQGNQWFGVDQEKTAFTMGVHQNLVNQGVIPDSPEYIKRLDSRIKEVYGRNENSGGATDSVSESTNGTPAAAPASRNASQQPVAPATRSKGSRGRTVQLTKSELDLCKRMGLDPKKFAAEKVKLGGA